MVVGSELEKEVMGVVEEELIRGHVEGIAEKGALRRYSFLSFLPSCSGEGRD